MKTIDDAWAELAHAVSHMEIDDDSSSAALPPRARIAADLSGNTPDELSVPLSEITSLVPGPLTSLVPGPLTSLVPGPHEDSEPDDSDEVPAWCPWLRAAPNAVDLQGAIGHVQHHLLAAENSNPEFRRARARKQRDASVFNQTVEALVCHLTREMLRGAGPIRLSADNNALGRPSRYKSELETKQLPTILRLMCAEEFLFMYRQAERPQSWKFDGKTLRSPGRQAAYAAGPKLAALVAGVDARDVVRVPGDEVILLKGKWDSSTTPELVEYQRAPAEVSTYRTEVQAINAFRQHANIRWTGDPRTVDVFDRHTRRRFTRARWDNGGRLWSGFWQTLTKAERLSLVKIDDEDVVGIDYVGTILTLAYARVGHTIGDADPYYFDIDRDGRVVPTTRKQRKQITAARLNGSKDWPRELRAQFRSRCSWLHVINSLKRAHPKIADLFDADIGQAIAFTESTIMAAVLGRLCAAGIVALDVHDCVIVKRSAADVARQVMLEEFQRIAGVPARVTIETAAVHPLPIKAAVIDAAANF
jgi:hypothetical protein